MQLLHRAEVLPQRWQWRQGEGRCRVVLTILDTGAGLQGLLIGGEGPHIGGVVMAVPRRSLTGTGWSSDLYVSPVPGHKDCEVAQPLADALARSVNCPVVITAGIHSDNLTLEELALIKECCQELTKKACEALKIAVTQ